MASWVENRDELQATLATFAPKVKLKVKEGWVWDVIARVQYNGWMDEMAVGIGDSIYIPRNWYYKSAASVLRHEAQHCKQCRVLGLGSHWFGVVPFAIIYFLLLLPILLAVGRALLERNACAAQWRADLESGAATTSAINNDAEFVGAQLGSKAYGFALPTALATYLFKRKACKVIEKWRRSK
jgi:hypothetical protein